MADERVRVQCFVSGENARRIDALAERLKMSRAEFLERLLDAGLEDNEWIIKAVTSPMVQGIKAVLTGSIQKKVAKVSKDVNHEST